MPKQVGDEAKAQTTLGPEAFVWEGKPSAIYLAAAKIHEYQHASNGVRLRKLTEEEIKQAKEADPNLTAEDIAKIRVPEFTLNDINEEDMLSFNAMLKAKDKLGLTDEMVDWIKKHRKEFFKKLSEDKKKKYKGMSGD